LSGAEFARAHLGERAAWIIAHHVPAKRYLVATDNAYSAQLSPASIASLQRQGGPMSEAEVAEFRAHPSAIEAIMVRRWDDNAKDPRGPELTIAELLDAYDRLTGAHGDDPLAGRGSAQRVGRALRVRPGRRALT
jgi:predicted HD phosphohydrolase